MNTITAEAPVSQATVRVGFTPWAKDHLLLMTHGEDGESGYPKDAKKRVYIMTGHDVKGKRIRRELRGTLSTVYLDYNGRFGFVRLYVQWKDGRRHLVHTKVER